MKIDDSFQDRNKNVSEEGPKLIKQVLHNSLVVCFMNTSLYPTSMGSLQENTSIDDFPCPR